MSYANTVEEASTSELSSNLFEVRHRLESFASQIQGITARLISKNEQLIQTPPYPPTSGKAYSSGQVSDAAMRSPLIQKINDAVMDIDIALSELREIVAITETI